jgi:hypothetical protein
MKCDEVLPLIDPLLDNELPTQPMALLMEHIRNCPPCQDAWDGRLALRERFRALAAIPVPATALQHVDQSLIAHIQQQQRLTLFKRFSVWAAAAAVVLVPFAIFTFQKQTKHTEAPVVAAHKTTHTPATVTEIVKEFRQESKTPSPQARVDLNQLSQQAGFSISKLNLRNWRLASADMVKLPSHSQCLVRLVYVSKDAGKTRSITCYQACQGQIKAAGLNEHNIGGRYICCGKVQNFSVVYWPKQGLDHLLVSSLSEPDLMALALRT